MPRCILLRSLCIFFDLSKNFDFISHLLLFKKGFTGLIFLWIIDYLLGQSFQLKVNGAFSELMEVISGVRAGLITRLELSLSFMNGLQTKIDSLAIMYLYDNKIRTPSDYPVTLQQSLHALHCWVSESEIMLNHPSHSHDSW